MRAKKSSLRVFKLRSGEEIIAKIAGKPRGKITVERPMKINYSISADPYTGMKKSVIFFTDWLGGATELSVNIPTDFILVDLTPDPDMEQLYNSQRDAQDQFRAAVNNAANKDPLAELMADDDNYPMPTEDELKKLDEFLKQAIGLNPKDDDKKNHPPKKPKQPIIPPTFPPIPPPSGVVFTVSLPSDLINEWVQSGIMDYLQDCMSDFLDGEMEQFSSPPPPKKKKKKSASANKEKQSKEAWTPPTDEQIKQPDYGNKFTDWSPYLKDYISGITGENKPEGS